jgi:NADH:ubiquinone oxidoreductase subunit 5 (subunit L)/multisubunit Na+/H+ antiporter MnhA subunit
VAAGVGLLVASLLSVLYACKYLIAAFAGRPPRHDVREVPASMTIAQGGLALGAVLLGLFPGPALRVFGAVLGQAPAFAWIAPPGWSGAAPSALPTGYAPLALVAAGLVSAAFVGLALGRSAPEPDDVWAGGTPAAPGALAPDPAGFFTPVRESLARAYPALHAPRLSRPAWILDATDADRWLVRPVVAAARAATAGLRHVHDGMTQTYLLWQLAGAAALAALLWARR